MNNSARSETVTHDIRIQAHAQYLSGHSDPESGRYVFTYLIRMVNESNQHVRLLARKWKITDADSEVHTVSGPGVVGEFPSLAPGDEFSYRSYSQLDTSWGTMEGSYVFEGDDRESFDVTIGRFHLVPSEVMQEPV